MATKSMYSIFLALFGSTILLYLYLHFQHVGFTMSTDSMPKVMFIMFSTASLLGAIILGLAHLSSQTLKQEVSKKTESILQGIRNSYGRVISEALERIGKVEVSSGEIGDALDVFSNHLVALAEACATRFEGMGSSLIALHDRYKNAIEGLESKVEELELKVQSWESKLESLTAKHNKTVNSGTDGSKEENVSPGELYFQHAGEECVDGGASSGM